MRGRWLKLLALVAALTLVAGACNGDDDDGDAADDGEETPEAPTEGANVDGVYTIGTVLPLTGDLAAFGPGIEAGVRLAIQDANAAGGPLSDAEFVSGDSGTDPTTAQNEAQRLVTSERVDLIVGAAGTQVTQAGVLPVLSDNPSVGGCTPSATGAGLTPETEVRETGDPGARFSRFSPSDTFQAELMASKAVEAEAATMAIMNRADAYGQGLADALETEADAAGIDVVASIPVDPEGESFDSEVEEAVDADADINVLVLFPPEAGAIIPSLQAAGIENAAMLGSDGVADETLAGLVDPNDSSVLEGMLGTRPGAGASTDDFDARLVDELDVESTTFAAQAYECATSWMLGAVVAGSDDAREVSQVLIDVTSGGEECATFEECRPLAEAGEDFAYTGLLGTEFGNGFNEPSAGIYEFWEFDAEGAISTLETVTLEA